MSPRTLILSISIAIGLSACSGNKPAATDHFWSWFKSREAEFAELFSYDTRVAARSDATLQKKTKDTINGVREMLRTVHPEFSPFFGVSNGTNELVVTVNGQSELFETVDGFIASAPPIDGWKFTALKQPLSLAAETEIRSGTVQLKVDDFRYTKSRNANESYDFTIHVPAKVSDDPEGFLNLFTRLTMDFLGERLASTVVGKIDVVELSDASAQDLLPLVDIHADVSRDAIAPLDKTLRH